MKYMAGTRRRTVYFAGVISNHISSDEFEVQFLKSNKCSFFVSVSDNDIDTVNISDIVDKLPDPTINNRRQYLITYDKYRLE